MTPEYVWVWDDLDAGTGFYGVIISEAGGVARVRVVTRGTRNEHVINSVVSVPSDRVQRGAG